jgi:hypothetical protein
VDPLATTLGFADEGGGVGAELPLGGAADEQCLKVVPGDGQPFLAVLGGERDRLVDQLAWFDVGFIDAGPYVLQRRTPLVEQPQCGAGVGNDVRGGDEQAVSRTLSGRCAWSSSSA